MLSSGCLLYAAFEWEDAAESFASLSEAIPIELYSTKCLINTVLIHARLGVFSKASQILAEAVNIEELLPIILSLMGQLEYELGNYEKAEDCFNISLQAIDLHQVHRHLGLDFVLRDEQIEQNLRVLRLHQGMVATVPGDMLFQAPPRKTDVESRRSSGRWSFHSDASSEEATLAITPIDPLVPRPPTIDDESDVRSERHREIAESQTSRMATGLPSRSTIPEDPVPVPRPVLSRQSRSSSMATGLPLQSTTPKEPVSAPPPVLSRKGKLVARYTKLRAAGKKIIAKRRSNKKAPEVQLPEETELRPPVKQIKRMEARDAKPGGNTTADLSAFIRELPKQDKLEARDARGRPGPTRELAEFIRGTGPDDIQAAMAMVSRASVESPPLMETEGYGSRDQRRFSRRTTLSSMTSRGTQQDDMSEHASHTEALPVQLQRRFSRPEPSGNGIIESALGRWATVASSVPWSARDGSDTVPQEAVRLQPRAVHPALRPDFSLDGQYF